MIVSANLLPVFAEIIDIIVLDTDNIYIVSQGLYTSAFILHYHSYEVSYIILTEHIICKPSKLIDPCPLSVDKDIDSLNNNFVTLKYYIIENIQ